MNSKKPFTEYTIVEPTDKYFYFIESWKLNLPNTFSPDDLDFFQKYYGDKYSEIIYFEYERPICPNCGVSMNSNGSRPVKPNMKKNIRKKQYICPKCGKTHCTSLENFIKRNSNYTRSICEKALEYEKIEYSSYQKKAELIELENNIKLNRQTVYYHESTYANTYITQKEKHLQKNIKKRNIQPSGVYHYDEEYMYNNGEKIVRLSLIDAVNNLIICERLVYQEDFDKNIMEIFLKRSLKGIPKKVLITDGHPAYPAIIEKIGIKHQICIFHIIKNHHDKSYKKINKLERRIKTLETKIKENQNEINQIREYSKGKTRTINNKEKTRKRNIKRRKKLDKINKKYRKELKQKRKELTKQEKINQRIENIHDITEPKGAIRRFNTIYNQKDEFDEDTQRFLKNLDKKFQKTITYYDDPNIPRTNNKIEGYFKITLPKNLKRKYRTEKGQLRWLKLQKLRWTERNVLNNNLKYIQNVTTNQKIKATS